MDKEFYNNVSKQSKEKFNSDELQDKSPLLARVSTCAPCAKYQLEIKLNQQSNQINWPCNCNDLEKSTPKKLIPIVDPLKQIIYQRENIKILPASSCRFH